MMSGWKTWVAAAASILWGVNGFLQGTMDPNTAMGFVLAGLAAVGIGHKLEKNATQTAQALVGDDSASH